MSSANLIACVSAPSLLYTSCNSFSGFDLETTPAPANADGGFYLKRFESLWRD